MLSYIRSHLSQEMVGTDFGPQLQMPKQCSTGSPAKAMTAPAFCSLISSRSSSPATQSTSVKLDQFEAAVQGSHMSQQAFKCNFCLDQFGFFLKSPRKRCSHRYSTCSCIHCFVSLCIYLSIDSFILFIHVSIDLYIYVYVDLYVGFLIYLCVCVSTQDCLQVCTAYAYIYIY